MSDGYPRWGDYDNDGDLDLLLGGDAGGLGDVTKLYRNDGGRCVHRRPRRSPWRRRRPISTVAPAPWPTYNTWADLDNDGDLDHASRPMASRYTRNDGGWRFRDIVGSFSLAASACADFDNDGDTDLVGSDPSLGERTTASRTTRRPRTRFPGRRQASSRLAEALAWSPPADYETTRRRPDLQPPRRHHVRRSTRHRLAFMASAAGYRRVFGMGGDYETMAPRPSSPGWPPPPTTGVRTSDRCGLRRRPLRHRNQLHRLLHRHRPHEITTNAGSGSGSISCVREKTRLRMGWPPEQRRHLAHGDRRRHGIGDGTVTYSVSPEPRVRGRVSGTASSSGTRRSP